MNTPLIFLVAHNIRSLHNVGSLFRSADGAGVGRIYLTGYSGTPLDKFKRPRKEVAKVALGAEKIISWESKKNLGKLIGYLQREKIFVVALELNKEAVPYTEFAKCYAQKISVASGIALLVGNEVRGVSPQILKKCDAIIYIPMHGKKESLNVGVATGIALFKLREVS